MHNSLKAFVTAAIIAAPLIAHAQSGGDAAPADATLALVAVAPSTAHGENFLFESEVDTNFCIDVQFGDTEGRQLTLGQCSTSPSQVWTLSYDVDNQNQMLDFEGMCVDARRRIAGDGIPLEVFKCANRASQKFSYTATGHLLELKSGNCLWVSGAVVGTAISLNACDDADKRQVWKLAR
jgi:hypothetical protein